MKLEYTGKLTSGYYNEMEAGHPVFIDDEPIDEIIKALLRAEGASDEFCISSFGDDDPDNPLIGKRVRLTLEIDD